VELLRASDRRVGVDVAMQDERRGVLVADQVGVEDATTATTPRPIVRTAAPTPTPRRTETPEPTAEETEEPETTKTPAPTATSTAESENR
jgi:hypothetical protein